MVFKKNVEGAVNRKKNECGSAANGKNQKGANGNDTKEATWLPWAHTERSGN